jgi:XTP/dITP diphosphohydrolase
VSLEILIATKNPGKIRELQELLAGLPIILHHAGQFSDLVEPEETGLTFTENAILKARYYAEKTGFTALADDSGLEVDALGGAPGVYSARYAGEKASSKEQIDRLLGELGESSERSARFVCVMAVSDPRGEIRLLAEGVCEGSIARYPRGKNGFGYDPIFIPADFTQTFGELSAQIKRKISHRGRAMEKIIRFFRDFAAP